MGQLEYVFFVKLQYFLWYLHKREVKSLLLFLLLVLVQMDLHVPSRLKWIYTPAFKMV